MSKNDLPVIDKERTGNKIKMLMDQKHMSVSQLQIELGMASATNVYAWLRGQFVPSTDKLVQIAKLLNCKVDDLLVIEED